MRTPLGSGFLSALVTFNPTIMGLLSGPHMPGMKSRDGYADKEKDLFPITTDVGAFRKSLTETDKFSFVWPSKAGNCLSGDAAVINSSIKGRMTFMGLSKQVTPNS